MFMSAGGGRTLLERQSFPPTSPELLSSAGAHVVRLVPAAASQVNIAGPHPSLPLSSCTTAPLQMMPSLPKTLSALSVKLHMHIFCTAHVVNITVFCSFITFYFLFLSFHYCSRFCFSCSSPPVIFPACSVVQLNDSDQAISLADQ